MKKYLLIGTLVIFSLVVFAPKTFAIRYCTLDGCVTPGWYCSDPSTGTCVSDVSGDFTSKNLCTQSCGPVTTLTLSPASVNVGGTVIETWSSTKNATGCTATIDNSNGVGTTVVPLGPSGSGPVSWSVPGTWGVSIFCSNAYGDGPTVRQTVTVNAVCNNNGIQDNGETGIDCGGGGCAACPVRINPTLTVSVSPPASGIVPLSGSVSYSLTSNDSRMASDFNCSRFSSPIEVTGWANGTRATLATSGKTGNGGGSYGPINAAGNYTVGISCLDSTGADAGSASAAITANPQPPTLSIDPPNASVCVGSKTEFSAIYNPGAERVGAAANLSSGNSAIITKESEGAVSDGFRAASAGATTISGSYRGLNASTNVTVLPANSANCNITFTITPNAFGSADQDAMVNIRNAPPNTWGDLTRTQWEYDNYPALARTVPLVPNPRPQWKLSDSSGSVVNSPTHHSCSVGGDGAGGTVKGYREEVSTQVNFGGRVTQTLTATKDCRGAVQVTYQNGNTGSWTISGMTSADNSTVRTVNKVNPGDNQSGSSGSDTYVNYKATDGGYTISTVCTVQNPPSQTLTPGGTVNFILSCAGGPPVGCSAGQNDPHFTCQGTSCVQVSGCGANQGGCTKSGDSCGAGGPITCHGPASGSRGQNLDFNVTGGSGGYSWAGGEPANSGSGVNYTTSFNTLGSKNVRVTDSVGGSSLCSVNIIAGGQHLECWINTCRLVDGAGADQGGCTRPDTACVPEGGCNPPYTQPYYVCNDYPSCVPAPGDTCGLTDCTACGGNHFACSGASCVWRANGPYLTSNCDNACVPPPPPPPSPPRGGGQHKECVNNACTSVANTAGNTSNRCGNSADCGTPPGTLGGTCGGPSGALVCMNVSGAGTGCSNDGGCANPGSASHLECQNATCVIVGGAGSNECNSIGAACSACTLTASPTFINSGGSSKLTWVCGSGVSGCSLKAAGSIDNLNPSGVATNLVGVSVKPTKSTIYTLSCSKGGGSVTTDVNVKVLNLQECNPNDPTCKPK